MINEELEFLGKQPNVIRETFAYGIKRKAEVGEHNVCDFSLGNPTVPPPLEFREAIIEALEKPPLLAHGYTPAAGLYDFRQAIAEHINKRYGVTTSADNYYITCGAAPAVAGSIVGVSNPGDEIIVIAPYFTEYKAWITPFDRKLVEVPARTGDFQVDAEAVEAAITPKTAAVIINSPNNPTGTIYMRETLQALADVLERASAKRGYPIYIISDEPYRELTYGKEVPYVPSIYKNTIICYSWSKSMSIPGNRIGYYYISEDADNADKLYHAVYGAIRTYAHVCAPAFFQHAVMKCLDVPVNVEPYAIKRDKLCKIMDDLGYEYVAPDGAFYLWIKALEEDDIAFAQRAKSLDLLILASTGFGCKGYVRTSYCVESEVIERSAEKFKQLKEMYS